MSFSYEVRSELCAIANKSRCCFVAELFAFLNAGCETGIAKIIFRTENELAALRFSRILFDLYNISVNVAHDKRIYSVSIYDLPVISKIINETATFELKQNCCRRAYTRGSFIVFGTLSDPEKAYHFEFTPTASDKKFVDMLFNVLRSFKLKPKTLERSSHKVIYFKEAENIADTLKVMEAHKSLLLFESVRVMKDMRNAVNRKVNCEASNIRKTINAALGQINDIRYIAETSGLENLPKNLAETAQLRLQYEDLTLAEIGSLLQNPISKSGVKHRLKKICLIADQMKKSDT